MSSRRQLLAVALLAGWLLAPASGMALTGTDTITTIAGSGVAGFSGDGGQATSAQLNVPCARRLAVSPKPLGHGTLKTELYLAADQECARRAFTTRVA